MILTRFYLLTLILWVSAVLHAETETDKKKNSFWGDLRKKATDTSLRRRSIKSLKPYERITLKFEDKIENGVSIGMKVEGDLREESEKLDITLKKYDVLFKNGQILLRDKRVLDGQGSYYFQYIYSTAAVQAERKSARKTVKDNDEAWKYISRDQSDSHKRLPLFVVKLKADNKTKIITFDYHIMDATGDGYLEVYIFPINEEVRKAQKKRHGEKAFRSKVHYNGKGKKGIFKNSYFFMVSAKNKAGYGFQKHSTEILNEEYLCYVSVACRKKLNSKVVVIIDNFQIGKMPGSKKQTYQ